MAEKAETEQTVVSELELGLGLDCAEHPEYFSQDDLDNAVLIQPIASLLLGYFINQANAHICQLAITATM